MIWFDLLYPSEEKWEQGKAGGKVSSSLVHDLQLERMVEEHVLDREEFAGLCQELEHLPVDREVILFRQEVLQDLIHNPHFLDKCSDFCKRLKNNAPTKRDIYNPSDPVYKNLEEHIGVLEANYHALCTANLGADTKFRSDALVQLAYFMENNEYKDRLREIIGLLKEILEAGAVRYLPEYTYGQVMESVVIQGLSRENTYVMKEKGLLKKTVVDRDYLIPADNIILSNNMEEIYSKTIVRLCDFASRLNSTIVGAFRRIQKEIPYYRAGIRLYEMYCGRELSPCLPQVEEGCGAGMEFMKLYPIHLLARKPVREIQSNSYSNKEGRIAIITGHNSGGKTTFLQAAGTAQIMMQLGFFVPADFYKASAAPFICSLYAGSEDADTIYGKLEQELVEIRAASGMIKEGSLLLMNEIFATTSEREGADIAAEVLHAFSHTHSHMIFVTHLKCLADMAEDGKLTLADGERAVNYVTERVAGAERTEGPGQVQGVERTEGSGQVQGVEQAEGTDGGSEKVKKTYRIVRGHPEAGIFERELFDKYFGTALGSTWTDNGITDGGH